MDLSGGLGTQVTVFYDEGSFYGVNFYKADNITPLGVHNTCSVYNSFTHSLDIFFNAVFLENNFG